jgi:hypothetical protein
MSPRLLRPRQAGGFDPRSIANLVWWLDASDISTMSQNSDGTGTVSANSDPVGRINNKASTSFNATQPTNNLRPTLLTSGMNGRPALSVSSTSQSGFSSIGIPSTAAANTYFFVGRYGGSSGWLTMYGSTVQYFDATQSGSALNAAASSGSPTYRTNRAAIGSTRSALYSAAINRNYLLTVEFLNLSAWTGNTWGFLNYNDATFNFVGTFCEVLLYSRSLSATEVSAVENALSAKWGIA